MFTTAKKLLDLLLPREKAQLYLLTAAMMGLAIVETAGIASIMPFIAVVHSPGHIQTNRWLKLAYDSLGFTSLQSFLLLLGMLALGMLVFSNAFKAFIGWWRLKFDNQLYDMLARRLLAHYMARPYYFFLDRNTTDMSKNVLAEVRTVTEIVGSGMGLLANALVTLFIVALLLAVDPLVAIVIMTVLGSAYAGIYLLVRRNLAEIDRVRVVANSMKFKFASEALSGIKDLKILGREREFVDRFAKHSGRHARLNVTAGTISQLPKYALEVIAFGVILVTVLYSLGKDEETSEIIPILALYAFAGLRLLPSVQQMFASVTSLRSNQLALEVVHRDLTGDAARTDGEHFMARAGDVQPLPFNQELSLRKVTFGYIGTEKAVLQGIDLTIAFNSSIGLVGATGSGKTTIVDLILGLLTPSSGLILVDGVEISGENLARWRRSLGYVPQGIFLCDDTIANNIALGVLERDIDMAAVIRATSIANLHEFIERELPDGYETMIGERGVRLSGGQRQRIGIARALYRDPSVLIMDEATSALDGITEEAVIGALHALSGKKTMITIAHRLTTVKECDVIYLMQEGRIVSQGTYDELLKASPWFRAAARIGA